MATRRTFLRGIASTVALPMLESLGSNAAAQTIQTAAHIEPVRLAYIYQPNGVNVDRWFPQKSGTEFELSDSLAPLEAHKSDLHILSGLELDSAKANGNGPGDHARANATFLTGCIPNKTAGADIRVGISADQIAARELGKLTRLPSLEMSTGSSRSQGECDSGYSCAYQYNLSWRNEHTPAPAERNPRRIFETLFGTGDPKEDKKRIATNKSVLDYIINDAKKMAQKGSLSDRTKIDQYLTSVREIERRIEHSEHNPIPDSNGLLAPSGIPKTHSEHIRLMYDMLILAFQTDSTRIASFMLAHDGSNKTIPEIGINTGHHNLSHHKKKQKNLDQIAKIDKYYAEHFSYFLERLKAVKENDKSLLDQSMIVFGGGISDGNSHSHTDLPIIVAGKGGGQLTAGKHTKFESGTPLTNMHLSLLKKMGVQADQVGDSTGVLEI